MKVSSWVSRLIGAALLVLAGCGGGESSSDGPRFTVRFEPGSVAVESIAGMPSGVFVTAFLTASGVAPGTRLYIAADGGADVLADVESPVADASQVQLLLHFRTDLAPGVYDSELRVLLCTDETCGTQFAGSPFPIRLKATIKPNIQVPATLALQRSGTGAAPTASLAVTVPDAARPLQLSAAGVATDAIQVALVGDELRITTSQVRAGTYVKEVVLSDLAGRYRAVTTVTYTVTAPAGGETDVALSESVVDFNLHQSEVASRRISVRPATWTPDVEITSDVDPTDTSISLVPAGPGAYELRVDTANAPPGTYSHVYTFRALPDGVPVRLPVTYTIDAMLTVPTPVPIVLAPATAPMALRGNLPVTMADGSAVGWSIDTSNLPPFLRLARVAGTTGVDTLGYEIDAALVPQGRLTSFSLSLGVNRAGVQPVALPFSLDERLPRVAQSSPLAIDTAQRGQIFLLGSFPEDVVATGRLEVFGATLVSAARVPLPPLPRPATENQYATALDVVVKDMTAGVPVTFRLDYPSLRTTANLAVFAGGTAPAYSAALPFETRRPPVWSAVQQAYYFVAGGEVRRLALQGGVWVETRRGLAEALDLDLARNQRSLIVMNRTGLVELDAATLQPLRSPVLNFTNGPLASGLASSWNKLMVVSRDDRMWWVDVELACGVGVGNAWLSGLGPTPLQPLGLLCNGNTSSFGLAVSGNRNVVAFFKNDSTAEFLRFDTLQAMAVTTPYSLGASAGLVSADWDGNSFVDGAGGFHAKNAPFREGLVGQWAPAGFTVGAYAVAGTNENALSYAYTLAAGPQGPVANSPTLFISKTHFGSSAPPFASVALPMAVGCAPGRPVDEPCTHRAQLSVDPAGRHAMVLGPQGVAVVPLAAGTLAARAPAAPILRRAPTRRISAPIIVRP